MESTLPDHGQTFDQSIQNFMETTFEEIPEGVSEALSTSTHTVMVSRDPFRPLTHWCVTILHHGIVDTAETPAYEDLQLSLARAFARIRGSVLQGMFHSARQRGFVNLA